MRVEKGTMGNQNECMKGQEKNLGGKREILRNI